MRSSREYDPPELPEMSCVFSETCQLSKYFKMSKTLTCHFFLSPQVEIKELFGNYRKTGLKELQYERAAAEIRKVINRDLNRNKSLTFIPELKSQQDYKFTSRVAGQL
jgi:hypothetical protein